MKSYVRIGGEVVKILRTLTWGQGGGFKNFQNHPYVIKESPLGNTH